MTEVTSPLVGTVVHLAVRPGDHVDADTLLLSIEAMKMEYPVRSPETGLVDAVLIAEGDTVTLGQLLVTLVPDAADAAIEPRAPTVTSSPATPTASDVATGPAATTTEPSAPRPPALGLPATTGRDETDTGQAPTAPTRADLARLLDRRARLLDAARPDAVAARRARGRRTARENLDDLVDPGSFVEYGGLAIAAQRQRRSVAELEAATPADGLVAGTATVNAGLFGPEAAGCVVLAYDYTVLAGTQGYVNHRKKDRMLRLAADLGLPVVLFAEGGGGRPGDTDVLGASWLDAEAFHLFARLSGRVPTIAIVDGYCFAGNAALAGSADLIIATEGSNLGMAGPAMIEGGGLGVHTPESIGPIEVQRSNGVVDIVVRDDVAAVSVARQALGLLQGDLAPLEARANESGRGGAGHGGAGHGGAGQGEQEPGEHEPGERGPAIVDQRRLRAAIPEDRRQLYDVRALLDVLVDPGTLLELRRDAAPGMLTALARLDGRAVGILANDPHHLGGAIDAEGADSAVQLLELCSAHGLPVVVLCDTPGFMVGPDAERDGGVRRFSRMFLAGARLTVPLVAVVTRKAYGLGAQAMLGGHLRTPIATLAWPTAELGPMGLEGAVRLGFRRELEAIEDLAERADREQQMIAAAYQHAGARNVASFGEIDDVIDPAETRARLAAALAAAVPVRRRPRPEHG